MRRYHCGLSEQHNSVIDTAKGDLHFELKDFVTLPPHGRMVGESVDPRRGDLLAQGYHIGVLVGA